MPRLICLSIVAQEVPLYRKAVGLSLDKMNTFQSNLTSTSLLQVLELVSRMLYSISTYLKAPGRPGRYEAP